MFETLLQNAEAFGWWRLAAIPLVSAVIGWITNVLAVRMIFRPRRPIHFPGWTLQGLVPKRQPELAASIGHTVEQHLVSHTDVMALLNKPEAHDQLKHLIDIRVGEFMEQKVGTLHPMVGMFLTGSLRQKLHGVLVEEVVQVIPKLTEQMLTRLENELDFRAIVEEKVRQFDLDNLEKLILDIAGRELKAIELLGGVLGFAIGLIQLALVLV